MKDKKARVRGRTACTPRRGREGIVPGGGVAFIRTKQVLEGKLKGDNHDQEAASRS